MRDGLRAVKNMIDDEGFVPGAGAFEIAAYQHLLEFQKTVQGKAKLGVQTFAEALLVIPKTLAENCGYDVQDTILNLIDAFNAQKVPIGLNCQEEGIIQPEMQCIYDNFCVKR